MSRYIGPVGSFRLSFVSTMVDAAMKAPASAESYAHISELFIFFCAARERCEHIGPTVTGVFSCASLVG